MGTRKACRVDTCRFKSTGLIVDDPSGLSSHRTRSNRRPNETLHAPAALVIAVDAVYEALEDRQ